MSLRLQSRVEATRCAGPFIRRVAKSIPVLAEEYSNRIGRLHGEINSRQPRSTQRPRLDHLVFRLIGLAVAY